MQQQLQTITKASFARIIIIIITINKQTNERTF